MLFQDVNEIRLDKLTLGLVIEQSEQKFECILVTYKHVRKKTNTHFKRQTAYN